MWPLCLCISLYVYAIILSGEKCATSFCIITNVINNDYMMTIMLMLRTVYIFSKGNAFGIKNRRRLKKWQRIAFTLLRIDSYTQSPLESCTTLAGLLSTMGPGCSCQFLYDSVERFQIPEVSRKSNYKQKIARNYEFRQGIVEILATHYPSEC